MSKCALCGNSEADKKNTHYLTDSSFRSIGGRNKREFGSYYDISNNSVGLRYIFQRNTPYEQIVKSLGEEPTQNEIDEAKKNLFSVDRVFCTNCEKLFGKIEKLFDDKVLPSFKEQVDMIDNHVEIADSKVIRLYVMLQFWRSHVCNTEIILKTTTANALREIILDFESVDEAVLKQYPMAVSFVVSDKQKENRNHFAGYTNGKNPYVVFLNDFVFQLYDSEKDIAFDPLYGINHKENYKQTINFNEVVFTVNVITAPEWEKIANTYYKSEKIPLLKEMFDVGYLNVFGKRPLESEFQSFCAYFECNRNKLAYTTKEFAKLICCYFRDRYGFFYK